MKITAAVLHHSPVEPPYSVTRPIRLEEVELAPPGLGEVLVEVKAAGLCHSDISAINGYRPRPVPLALGHEAAGIIREIGPNVTRFKPGDHVVMIFVPSCGHCIPCAEGRPVLCEPGNAANGRGELMGGGRRLQLDGAPLYHHVGLSSFATHAVVSENSIVKIDDAVPFEIAALFGCAVLTGVGAVLNTAALRSGQSIAIFGLGGVGLSGLLAAIAAGADPVVAIDLLPEKLALAKSLGATHCFDARQPDIVNAVKQATNGGVHFAMEFAGSVPALETAFAVTRPGGTTVLAGLDHHTRNFSFPPPRLVGEERAIRGSYAGSCVPLRDVPRFIGLYRHGRLPVDRLLTSKGGLDGINSALDQLLEGKTVRHVFIM